MSDTRSPVVDAALSGSVPPVNTLVDVRHVVIIPSGKKCRWTGQDIFALIPTDPTDPSKPASSGIQYHLAMGGLLIAATAPTKPGEQPVVTTLREPTVDLSALLGALDAQLSGLGFQRIGAHRDDMEGLPTNDVIYHAVMPDGYQMTSEVDLRKLVTVADLDDAVQSHQGMVYSYNTMLKVYAVLHQRLKLLAVEGTQVLMDWPQMLMHHRDRPCELVLATIEEEHMDAYMGVYMGATPLDRDSSQLARLMADIESYCKEHLNVDVDLGVPVDGDGSVGRLTLSYAPDAADLDDALTATSGADDDDDSPPDDDGAWGLRLAEASDTLDATELGELEKGS